MSDSEEPTLDVTNAFSFDVVMRHLRTHHPGCPKESCHTIAIGVSARNWHGLKLGAAVGIELQKYIPRSLTDYDELVRSKMMTRDKARSFVAPQVQEVLSRWRKPGPKLRVARPAG
ncbi:DUF2293 domain-containing protein [Mesorhizobium abyssinicae]|uniref:DUF2293 domain-containing protein n=1 Tax=Mesorhizobium abyssinicae TaxID=1209958 RepID=A0ABU5AVY7_9HYPH|nr:DUF2293 domain-containing protein [Mesorhizobium abyssinicae]MDX8541468.1 DUF2293 domain-containing protein [Mesorhizobium abyssinicae]